MVWHKNVKDAVKLLSNGKAKFRSRGGWSVAVECWFCRNKSEVPFGNRNCWDCPSCEQYNGFLEDGDYNKPIPAQRNEELNHPVSPLRPLEVVASPSRTPSTPLCYSCQQNQLIKVRQLADFVPYNEADYDLEVEAYSRHLEVVYRLCHECEQRVRLELQRQDREIHRQYNDDVDEDSDTASQISGYSVCSTYIPHIKTAPISWPIKLLRLLALLLATLMLICCISNYIPSLTTVKALQDPSSSSSNNSDSNEYKILLYHLESACQLTPVFNFVGFFFSVIAIFVLGQEWLTGVDVGQIVTWSLLVLLLLAPKASIVMTGLVQHLHTLLTASVFILSVLSLCQSRKQEATLRSPATYKKFRRDIRSANSSPVPSVAGSRNQNLSEVPPARNASIAGARDDACSERFDSLTLGTPVRRKQQGVQFGRVSSSTNGQHSAASSPTGPAIISPAKFVYKKKDAPFAQPSLRRLSRSKLNKDNIGRTSSLNHHQFDDESHSSSRYAVVSTSASNIAAPRVSWFSKFVLGVSIGVNICVVIYLTSIKSHLKIFLEYLLWLTDK